VAPISNPKQAQNAPGLRAVPNSLHLRTAATLTTSSTCRLEMGFVELRGDRGDVGLSERVQDDAFLIAVQLKKCPDFDLYADNRLFRHRDFSAGTVAIYDLRMNLLFDLRTQQACDVRDSFHAIDFYLPRKSLDALADDSGSPRVDELRHQPGMPISDLVARDLIRSIQPTLAVPPGERNELFVDYVAKALATHAAHTYGGMRMRPAASGGRLAPWQERRAKDLLASHLDGSITLAMLASECELSIRHFTRAFRASTGMSPHGWLLQHRIEMAKKLLISSPCVLVDVAFRCGFADQSHLTRTFKRAVGVSPGTWRRLHRR